MTKRIISIFSLLLIVFYTISPAAINIPGGTIYGNAEESGEEGTEAPPKDTTAPKINSLIVSDKYDNSKNTITVNVEDDNVLDEKDFTLVGPDTKPNIVEVTTSPGGKVLTVVYSVTDVYCIIKVQTSAMYLYRV